MTVGESPDAWRDHPRVCGEYQNVRFSDDWDGGSSPRMRGTRAVRAACGRAGGIIPAYAGNTRWMIPPVRARGDHPRVCGEHCGEHSASFGVLGSSPRMRETHSRCRRAANVTGIIPAYAGNTVTGKFVCALCRDHPRICGEHDNTRERTWSYQGSSPHMRGTCNFNKEYLGDDGIIPAYAGNTCSLFSFRCVARDHPRICGEHTGKVADGNQGKGSSPHMRGTPRLKPSFPTIIGIIPAYAGNTIRSASNHPAERDHPRICGEHVLVSAAGMPYTGSSPHMRGTRARIILSHLFYRGSSPHMRGTRG